MGDSIVIQEKVDGANASFRYDAETCKLVAFSRKQELSFEKNLNGFWNYVSTLDSQEFRNKQNYVYFGEWLLHNAIKYIPEAYDHWYVYDIFDISRNQYLPQTEVEEECKKHGFIYVKTFYTGPFISWEHCKSFVGQSDIAVAQGEGVVVKNQTKLNEENERLPFVLKIVGKYFSEVKKSNHREKVLDPMKLKEQEKARLIVDQIVTQRRVEKELFKMRDEGILPDQLEPQDMKTIAMNLPKRIFDDCMKEEQNLVIAAGPYFGKMSSVAAMQYAKKLVLGKE